MFCYATHKQQVKNTLIHIKMLKYPGGKMVKNSHCQETNAVQVNTVVISNPINNMLINKINQTNDQFSNIRYSINTV